MKNLSEKMREVFSKALEKADPKERSEFLDNACGEDRNLRKKVDALIVLHSQAGDFLESPPFIDQPAMNNLPEETPGTIIDRYKLLEKIGEGGMAVVYMAEQEKPIRRKVAMKIIKLGMDTKSVIARFEAERQALAMMDHPNIAKVFDAGATETGRPYFVMELVTGVSITEYCDKNNLSTQERLMLFIQVCNAVQHAHQKGIIHRDIKPTNVMLTLHDGEPVPKVIDFGIAKAINQKLTEKTLFTRYAHMVGTPAYMSPEQAEMSGLDVDTRTDIYSLGVLLYELLTGTTPFDSEELHKASLSEMQRIICEEEPTKPSTKLSSLRESLANIARRRNTNPDVLPKQIRGDLDWIVMKCLEKERTRRYETAHGLAEDIDRHLRNEPILAGSPGLVYRAQKFLRRHQSHITTTAVIIVLLAGLVITASMYLRSVHARKVQWAQGEALPEIIKLIEQQDYRTAFTLAKRAKEYIPDDPALNELWTRICKDYSIATTPAGASISYRENPATDAPWEYLGQSPLDKLTLPQGTYRWKIEKEGFDTHECVADNSLNIRLREEDLPGEMVWIGTWKFEIPSPSSDQITVIEVPSYLMDKYEVTNKQFKQFVDQGGYTNQDYWRESQFLKEGRNISWEQAISEFVDKTSQPGPATWEGGTYPEGQDQHPVSGVSWYEAAAYAKFVGKSLPTVHHWKQAACTGMSVVIVPFSNFDIAGTASVGSHPGMGRTGLYDMAGNVKEWCFNATDDSGNLRYILGGGLGEPTYMFVGKDSRLSWDRSPLNGFRCVQYLQGEESLAPVLFRAVELSSWRDLSNLVPFSDEEFRVLKARYGYDHTPLNAIVQSTDDSLPFWRKEKITFDAAYGGERVIVHLFLPKTGEPPYQTVIYFPGLGAVYDESFDGLPYRDLTEHIIMNGRALLCPIYKGTYERPAARGRIWTSSSIVQTPFAYREWIIKMAQDLSRSIDYLETRDDFDSERIAYYGISWGAQLGPIMLAVEDRFDAGVFVVGGIPHVDLPRSFDIALYAQRVKTPVLMVNGTEDVAAPLKTSALPMYELLGTADENKKHKLYPGGHGVFGLFYKQIRKDVLAWLDRYLGEVK
ncbi:MAG: protein kinase domain-containing protein [Planctomycetota bacterium]|jgi:serine/threonine protein kinase/formylglycine-generating enzyme required for sulfatase activity/dienelactone hydrolase